MSDRAARGERLFLLLMLLFPRSFRAAYQQEMLQVLRDRLRDARSAPGGASMTRLWTATLLDVTRSALAERLEATMTPFVLRRLTGVVLLLGAAIVALYTLLTATTDGDRPAALDLALIVTLSGGLIGLCLLRGAQLAGGAIAVLQALLLFGSVALGGVWWLGAGAVMVLVVALLALGITMLRTPDQARWLGALVALAGLLLFLANPDNAQIWLGLPLGAVWAAIGYAVWTAVDHQRAALS